MFLFFLQVMTSTQFVHYLVKRKKNLVLLLLRLKHLQDNLKIYGEIDEDHLI